MPTNRVLYTLGDIKSMLAETEGVAIQFVNNYECNDILIDNVNTEDEKYLFQVDKEVING